MTDNKLNNDCNIDKIFQYFKSNNPNPKTELRYNNNYTLLVAVTLSAQATDISVNKACENLFKNVSSAKEMLDYGIDNLKKDIKSIGLWQTKAKNVMAAAKIIHEEYNGVIPDEFEKLVKLPGVGRKTANVVLNEAFNKPTIAVDTHVYRVSRRLGLSNNDNILKLENDILQIIPQSYKLKAHHWLILHGRYICKAQKPNCDTCKISPYCPYFKINNEKMQTNNSS